jgi:hypothetical protein
VEKNKKTAGVMEYWSIAEKKISSGSYSLIRLGGFVN